MSIDTKTRKGCDPKQEPSWTCKYYVVPDQLKDQAEFWKYKDDSSERTEFFAQFATIIGKFWAHDECSVTNDQLSVVLQHPPKGFHYVCLLEDIQFGNK